MSDKTHAENDNSAEAAEKAARRHNEADAAPESEADTAVEDAAEGENGDDGSELRKQNAELSEHLLRLAAELDNYRKRAERELADTRTYAIAGFARDMLSATDSLSRALMTLPAEARDTADGPLKSLIDGIELTEREMQRLLAKHGVKPIAAEGERFDPHRHQAMFEVPDPTRPEGTVVQVVQAGFSIGERVLRPAMVGVAKGGPKGGPKASAKADPGEQADDGGIDKSV